MSKMFKKKTRDARMKVVFGKTTKAVGGSTLVLSYDDGAGRFDLHKDGDLLVSSMVFGDCVAAAERHGANFSEDELKIELKSME